MSSPDRFDGERRETPRHERTVRFTFRMLKAKGAYRGAGADEAALLNVSRGGALFVCRESLTRGSVLEVVESSDSELLARGQRMTVLRVEHHDGQRKVAVEFPR